MPTVSWQETFPICFLRAKALVEAEIEAGLPCESVVVFDGVIDPLPSWLQGPSVKVCTTGQRSGPAAARNLAALEATGDVLVFVDADVELHPQSLRQFRQAFYNDPTLDAVFGSYDDAPSAPGVVSRFRNLLHHHTHHLHPGTASSFWAGCGAMRRDRFLELGGFDTTYSLPSIEDVDLGLRLWRRGGRIVLDPTIQGCHHKRWTLTSMVLTDIRQRALPWSCLLLEQSDTPATLNFSLVGRLSGALAPLVPLGMLLTLAPASRIPGAALAATALLLLVAFNLAFHRLHLRRCGWLAALAGVGLHVIHLCCASGTFTAVACFQTIRRPMAWPRPFRHHRVLRRGLAIVCIAILALLALLVISKGLVLGWSNAKDLRVRWQEWQLLSAGHFPMGGIYGKHPPPGMRSSPYPVWAIPMFGLFFHPGGLPQGILTIQLLSLVALFVIARCGWLYLRPHGTGAGCVGALSPLAISGNANALAVAQFSIICMGLIFLEWSYLRKQKPLRAGLCWALAMIKPQIALFHGAPLVLQKSQRRGFWTALLSLALLSVLALWQARLSPLIYGERFVHLLGKVQDDSGWNLSLQISQGGLPIWATLVGGFPLVLILVWKGFRLQAWRRRIFSFLKDKDCWMTQAGISSLLGILMFYHRSPDHIMLAPAFFAMADMSWKTQRLGIAGLTVLLGISLWLPNRLTLVTPMIPSLQLAIWTLSLLVLAANCFMPKSSNNQGKA